MDAGPTATPAGATSAAGAAALPPPSWSAAEAAVRAALLDAARAALAVAPAAAGVVLDDATPRADQPEDPPEGVALVYLRGAVCRVPLAGLTRAYVDADARSGLALTLQYAGGAVKIADHTRSPYARALVADLLARGADLAPQAIAAARVALTPEANPPTGARDGAAPQGELEGEGEPDSEPEVGPASADKDTATPDELATLQGLLDRESASFGSRYRTLRRLRGAALGATLEAAEAARDLAEAYSMARLLHVKAALCEAVGDAPASALAAGPTGGLLLGGPGGAARSAFIDGPDDMTMDVSIDSDALGEADALALLISFRPFARRRAQGLARARAASDDASPRGVLAALSALHLAPDLAHAKLLLGRLRAQDEGPRSEAIVGLAKATAAWLELDEQGAAVLVEPARK